MTGIYNRGTAEQPRWYCHYVDCDGKRKHRRLRVTTREQAERQLAEILERVARGEAGQPLAADAPGARVEVVKKDTLAELAQRYLQEAAPRSKDPERYRATLRWLLRRHVLPELGGLPLSSLSAASFEGLAERMLADGYKIATLNAVVRSVSVVFSWAKRRGLYEGANPMNGLQRSAPQHEVEYFTQEEVARLLDAAQRRSPDVYALLKTALYTGLRKGELFGLRWTDVDLERGTLCVRRSYRLAPKSGRFRTVPIHPELVVELRELRERHPDRELLFPVSGRMGTPHDMCGLHEIIRSAGVREIARPWHAMRHSFASHYVMNGGNLLALQRMLGHSRFEMTQIYSHLSAGFLAAEILRVPFGGRRS